MPHNHWHKLIQSVQSLSKPVALAFSGGLDSRFLAHALQKAHCPVTLYHATGPHIPKEESLYAQHWAKARGLSLTLFSVDVCALPHVQNNSQERCYYCKKHLLSLFTAEAKKQDRLLCDGTNADDLAAHRPGLKALQEHNVLSPLAAVQLHKKHIRACAESTSLENPHQKASPCLLTRLHYGMPVDAQILSRIDQAERALQKLLQNETLELRLRLTPTPVLQCTKQPSGEETVHTTLAQYGFHNVDLLIEEHISGFFDRK